MSTLQRSKIRAIITGSTGMVGEGVLLVCLQHPLVEKVLVINRKPCGRTHPKLKEIIHQNFFDLSPIESELSGYNACFFCLGVSSVGMKEEQYYKTTYTLTMNVAKVLCRLNAGMTFCYVSGGGTDSTEKGRMMWARVKGKTENDLMKLPFSQVFAFRPGYMHPMKEAKNTLKGYKWLGWLYPLFRTIFPNGTNRLEEVGLAMIEVASKGCTKKVLTPKDISALTKQSPARTIV